MRLVIVGCEYSGTTTLAHAINDWATETMGVGFRLIHDHFKQPDTNPHGPALTEDELAQFQALSARHREVMQRQNLYYHTSYTANSESKETSLVVGLHIDETIYGPLYFGYGGAGQIGDRHVIAKHIEQRIVQYTPETVLVHVKARSDIILQRMTQDPHARAVLRETDVEHVLARFEEEVRGSLLMNKITLDTSDATVAETVADFERKVHPFLTQEDLARILVNRSLK